MPSDSSIRLRAILVFFTCIFRNIHGELKILEEPLLYQEVSPGDDVTLSFKIQNKAGRCLWRKDGNPVEMQSNKYEWSTGNGNDNCTLLIKCANLMFDNGVYQCEVIPSNFFREDKLISNKYRLVVKAKPKKPELQYKKDTLGPILTLIEGKEEFISCISRYGNPPAVIKWFIGDREMEPVLPQTNTMEVDNPKTWMANSTVLVRAQRENSGLSIRCVVIHPTSSTPISTKTLLDVYYSPKVRLVINPQPHTTAPKDSLSSLQLNCLADANPPPIIEWLKDSVPFNAPFIKAVSSSSSSLIQDKQILFNNTIRSAELRFEPVNMDEGLYSCRATNIIGESALSYRLDMQRKITNYETPPVEPIVENEAVTKCFCAKLDTKNLQKEDCRTLLIEDNKDENSVNIKWNNKLKRQLANIALFGSISLLVIIFPLILIWE